MLRSGGGGLPSPSGEPQPDGRADPGDLLPEGWRARVVERVHALHQVLAHDDGAGDRQLQVVQRAYIWCTLMAE